MTSARRLFAEKDSATAVATFADGSQFVCGTISGTSGTFGAGANLVVVDAPSSSRATTRWSSRPVASAGSRTSSAADGSFALVADFGDTATFGAGAAPTTLTSRGATDIAVARFGRDGDLIFATQFGCDGGDFGADIETFDDDTLLVVGSFRGELVEAQDVDNRRAEPSAVERFVDGSWILTGAFEQELVIGDGQEPVVFNAAGKDAVLVRVNANDRF